MTEHVTLEAWCEELCQALGLELEASKHPDIQLLLDVSAMLPTR